MYNSRIAILTQPLGHNYGGLLQAYALQVYLKKLGCEVETLDRRTADAGRISAKRYVINVAKLLLGRIKSLPTASREAWVLKALADFREKRLAMSPKILSEQEIRGYYRQRNFDAFVVGSDQVWRPRYSPSILNFYLNFLDDIKSPAKRIAYAASFGVDEWEYSDVETEQCKKLAQKFDAISVREQSAIELCHDKLGIKAQWVVDPTLLLDREDYEQLIVDCGANSYAGCVLSYVLDPAPEKRSIADRVGCALGADVFSIKPEYAITQVCPEDITKCRLPSVEIWLQAFHDAQYVVTDSFHGTVFSILFNKPFIAVGNSARGMARFESLLSQFGLSERLVESAEDVTPELLHRQIEWGTVNDKRKALARAGQQFLHTQLFGS